MAYRRTSFGAFQPTAPAPSPTFDEEEASDPRRHSFPVPGVLQGNRNLLSTQNVTQERGSLFDSSATAKRKRGAEDDGDDDGHGKLPRKQKLSSTLAFAQTLGAVSFTKPAPRKPQVRGLEVDYYGIETDLATLGHGYSIATSRQVMQDGSVG
ncbi:hypothetical protein HK102_011975 [Quaeritorhiza haematococci]|nr:hypothetical protein HK102_011975 [Quaeritorhiza haematococci]